MIRRTFVMFVLGMLAASAASAQQQPGDFEAICKAPKGAAPAASLSWTNVSTYLLTEWKRFGYRTVELGGPNGCAITRQGKIEDRDAGTIADVQKYFRVIGETKTGKQVRCETSGPWSAVFISWIFVEAGAPIERDAGAGQGAFCPHEGHAGYVWHMARQAKLRKAGPVFRVHKASERAPQVGDLICAERTESGFDFAHYLDGPDSTLNSHCDIVVSLKPGKAYAIGGNVQDGVSMTIAPLDANGRLVSTPKWRHWQIVVEPLYPGPFEPVTMPAEAAPDGSKGQCFIDRPLFADKSLPELERCTETKGKP